MASIQQESNGDVPKPGSVRAAKTALVQQPHLTIFADSHKTMNRSKRPNYAQIHANALPLMTYPLPTFIPHNPLSYFQIAFTLIKHILYPPSSHAHTFKAYFDRTTRSVHVTDPTAIRALWEMGFFGKGSLSRSEPNWLGQEKRRLGLIASETSEEATEKRRKERERLKRERARAELEVIEKQLQKEAGVIIPEKPSLSSEEVEEPVPLQTPDSIIAQMQEPKNKDESKLKPRKSWKELISNLFSRDQHKSEATEEQTLEMDVINQEHLQLTLEETFFLIYGLGCLNLTNIANSTSQAILQLFRQSSYFPPADAASISPDDPFLVQYVVYHHFRSLGWVVRDGIKFAVDYLLYERGPVFKHAAFAIMIVPSYTHAYWNQEGLKKTVMQRRKQARDWTWLHCVNRVQTHVIKTLVLVYVDIPPPSEITGDDVGALLGQYRVREFCISRWSANRNRD